MITLYKVELKEECKEFYTCPLDHQGIGYKWQEDKFHIWFKFFRIDRSNLSYVSPPVRYIKADVLYKEFIINDCIE
jgi:hypothetical protein